MTILALALLSLAFSAWLAWSLYASIKEEKLSGFQDWISALWIGAGSAAGILTALAAVLS